MKTTKEILGIIGFLLGLGSLGIAIVNIFDFNISSIIVAIIFGLIAILIALLTKRMR